MTSQPPGCLAALFGWRPRPDDRAAELAELLRVDTSSEEPFDNQASTLVGPLPFRQRDDFLSPAEASFVRVLLLVARDRWLVCPKVGLSDIFFVARPHENTGARGRIAQKHVDFLICDSATLRPLVGIELDDASHRRPERMERDAFVADVFEAAGLPLVRFPVRRTYAPAEIEAALASALGLDTQPAPSGAPLPAAFGFNSVLCPKCGVPMVLRTARQGANAGGQFYGCPNFPRCREIVPVAMP